MKRMLIILFATRLLVDAQRRRLPGRGSRSGSRVRRRRRGTAPPPRSLFQTKCWETEQALDHPLWKAMNVNKPWNKKEVIMDILHGLDTLSRNYTFQCTLFLGRWGKLYDHSKRTFSNCSVSIKMRNKYKKYKKRNNKIVTYNLNKPRFEFVRSKNSNYGNLGTIRIQDKSSRKEMRNTIECITFRPTEIQCEKICHNECVFIKPIQTEK